MVTVVTGKMNEGKTTAMMNLHAREGGDGFVSLKRMQGNDVLHFDAMRLSDGETRRFAAHEAHTIIDFPEGAQLGPYRFHKETLDWIASSVDAMIAQKTSPIYLDEVGVLELRGEGFHHAISALIDAGCDLVLSIREDLVPKIIEKYDLTITRKLFANEVTPCTTSP